MSDLDDLAAAANQSRGQAHRQLLPPTSPPQVLPPQPRQVSYNPVPAYPNVPTPAGMERCWTVHDRGHQYGPHTEAELATLIAMGTISTTALVWRDGSPRWIPVSSVVPMPAYPPPLMVPAQAYAQQGGPPMSSNRIGIGLCAIFLGCLGIHKFMLGFTNAGVVMLLVALLGGCAYGMGTLAMAMIGFIEGIIYLTKTDAQFHQDYVIMKKQWF